MRNLISCGGIVALLSITAGCTIDGSVSVAAGDAPRSVRVIDGNVHVLANGNANNVRVIDGDISVARGGSVTSDIRLTDGKLQMEQSRVGRNITVHYGELDLDGAVVAGDMDIYCAGGELRNTTIRGELRVRKKALWYVDCDRPLVLEIGPGSTIQKLRVDDERIEVRISDDAHVGS